VLDLEVTPNRPDLLSHEGIAREIAALTGRAMRSPQPFEPETAAADALLVEAGECAFYSVRMVEDVCVGSSPEWLRNRLEALDLRSINNVVDITNLVLMESGQPLHAFDADKLRGALRVRFARRGESLIALDGKTYSLAEEDLVIADGSGPVAIAGVMGGQATAVNEHTTRVALESATFRDTRIRRTARRLGLSTDSSYRFERGVDVAGVLKGSQRALQLFEQVTGARGGALFTGVGASTTEVGALLMGLTPVRLVPLRFEKVASLLGATVPEARIDQILGALGLSKSPAGWEVPSFRPDLAREVDLVEEIARVVGLDYFPPRVRAFFAPGSETDTRYDRTMRWRMRAAAQGLLEARSLTLVSERMAQTPFSHASLLRVRNPLNEDQVVLRPSLVPGLLEAAGRNARAGVRSVRLFEVGRVFAAGESEERMALAVVMAGPHDMPSWRGRDLRDVDLADLRGVLETVLGTGLQWVRVESEGLLGVAAHLFHEGKRVGLAGQIRPSEARQWDIPGALFACELDLEPFLLKPAPPALYREVPRFPSIQRDIALIAPRTLAHGRIAEVFQAAKEPLLVGVELFDVFTDPLGIRVPADSKSLAYALTYRAAERTLTAEEINAAHSRLKNRLITELGVTVRE
jgi:phenylalanyl-tRNA synthetase beta chain